jgi:hypothetical protein
MRAAKSAPGVNLAGRTLLYGDDIEPRAQEGRALLISKE